MKYAFLRKGTEQTTVPPQYGLIFALEKCSRAGTHLRRADVFGIPLGIWVMRNREPLKVKRFAMLHNLLLFSLSLYMAVECVRQSIANFGRPSPSPEGAAGFRLFCNPNDAYSPDGGDTFSESGLALARVLYVHYISKVLSRNTQLVAQPLAYLLMKSFGTCRG